MSTAQRQLYASLIYELKVPKGTLWTLQVTVLAEWVWEKWRLDMGMSVLIGLILFVNADYLSLQAFIQVSHCGAFCVKAPNFSPLYYIQGLLILLFIITCLLYFIQRPLDFAICHGLSLVLHIETSWFYHLPLITSHPLYSIEELLHL